MATVFNFKPVIDLPQWRPLATAPATSAAGASMAYDERPNGDAVS